ncbi:MAG: 1-acyl-sn-glycerol-3-phosphate acyltransferase [Lachnospiraceae bacterium]|nr:1-acyl-sn-glycerol-3-phosphate acyltransferase [Lachnospiraceae bacterium]
MRTIALVTLLMIGLFFGLPYHLYMGKVRKTNPDKAWEMGRKYVSGYFKAGLFVCRAKVNVLGKENIPDEACLFVGNHRSYFDILISHEAIKRPAGFVAKKEILKVGLLALYMKDISCLFLDRNDIKQGLETMNKGGELLKQGHSMILFPEGTRSQQDGMLPFKEGGYKMAEKAKCPIVPFAITGSDLLLESRPKKGRFKKVNVTIEFAKPIYPTQMAPKDRKAMYAQIPDIIQGMKDNH